MSLDIDRIVAMVTAARDAWDLANAIADDAALALTELDQGALKARLAAIRNQNDADRARRHQKLMDAARA